MRGALPNGQALCRRRDDSFVLDVGHLGLNLYESFQVLGQGLPISLNAVQDVSCCFRRKVEALKIDQEVGFQLLP